MKTTTTDLMYAAFLVTLGGTIEEIESAGRYNKVHIYIPERVIQTLQGKTGRLERLAARAEDISEVNLVYDMSMLKDVADQYFILKKKLARMK